MDIGWKSRAFPALVSLYILWGACPGQTNVALAAQGNTNGAAGQMPAFYDGELFTVNMKELPQAASDSNIANNPSVNEIYASNDLDEEQDFIPVINAIQGAGFNPLWRQVLIVFNEGFAPHQFVSEEEIEEAAAGSNPEITLVGTDEVYRCSVVRRGSALAGSLLIGSADLAQPATGAGAFGFNGTESGFPTGVVRITGGGAYDLASGFVHSGGGFRCLKDVRQGPLSVSINPDDLGPCLEDEGVRWDTASVLASTGFKCTGAATEAGKTATTTDKTAVLQADFYRAGDGIDESFTAQMIVSETEIAPNDFPGANIWVQGVGCGTGNVNFR
jgi:hypothetical protein